jgi:sugar phosphate isomerase/epimerase
MKSVFSRREFVRYSAVGLAAYAASAALPVFSSSALKFGKPGAVRLGLASYTFRDFDRAHLIAFMKQLNVSALNAKDVKDHLPMDPAAERKALADYSDSNIKLHATGVIYFTRDDDDDIRNNFEYAKRAGVPVIVAGGADIKILQRIEKFVKQYDIRIAIHNHGPEDPVWPSPLTVLKAVNNMDHRMGCCIDVGHTVRAGTNVVEAIHAAGPRLFNMHMKDLTDFHNKESQVAVGEGKMPVQAIFEALVAIRYPGFVDLEYEIKPQDPMPGVTRSFAYMRQVLAG